MKECRVKLGESDITIRIEVDDEGYCLEACPLYKVGLDGFCEIPKMTILLGDSRYRRSRKCIESEVPERND